MAAEPLPDACTANMGATPRADGNITLLDIHGDLAEAEEDAAAEVE